MQVSSVNFRLPLFSPRTHDNKHHKYGVEKHHFPSHSILEAKHSSFVGVKEEPHSLKCVSCWLLMLLPPFPGFPPAAVGESLPCSVPRYTFIFSVSGL